MKSTCTGCGSVSECSCPEGTFPNYPDAKYFCDTCMELMDEGNPESELKDSLKRAEAAKAVKVDVAGREDRTHAKADQSS